LGVDGELDLETAPVLRDALLGAIREGNGGVWVDLAKCSFMDSTGLRAVIAADARARDRGARLVVVRAPEEVDRVFRLTRMDEHLEVVDEPPDGN
jgi:anti-anti-sigma factor